MAEQVFFFTTGLVTPGLVTTGPTSPESWAFQTTESNCLVVVDASDRNNNVIHFVSSSQKAANFSRMIDILVN